MNFIIKNYKYRYDFFRLLRLKTMLLSISFFILPTVAQEKLGLALLENNISSRCNRIVLDEESNRLDNIKLCSFYTKHLILALNPGLDSKTGALLFFKSLTSKIIKSPWIHPYLRELRSKLKDLQNFYAENDTFDVYAFTIDFLCRNNHSKNHAEVITNQIFLTIFQDNDQLPGLHVKYLEQYWANHIGLESLNALKEILVLINSKGKGSLISKLNMYPDSISIGAAQKKFNKKIYYYYFPNYIAGYLNNLKVDGFTNNRTSLGNVKKKIILALPIILATVYKYARHYNSYLMSFIFPFYPTAKIEKNGQLSVFPDWEYRYKDLYMAYVGASSALGRPLKISFELFREKFGTDPEQFIDQLN